MARNIRTMQERFWEKVDRDGPTPEGHSSYEGLGACWVYTGSSVIAFPRAHLAKAEGRQAKIAVARYSYTLHFGPVDDSLVVRHICDNGHIRCVNPAHLEVGTQKENVEDRYKRPRPNRRALEPGQVDAMRTAYSLTAISKTMLAKLLGVSVMTVHRALYEDRLGTKVLPLTPR